MELCHLGLREGGGVRPRKNHLPEPLPEVLQRLPGEGAYLQFQGRYFLRHLGVLDLESLQLAPDKLNQSFLQGSPYVLARGSINTIRVTMPSSQDRKGKNVEVKVRGVVLEMEPNQLFKESFERGLNLIKYQSINQGTLPAKIHPQKRPRDSL